MSALAVPELQAWLIWLSQTFRGLGPGLCHLCKPPPSLALLKRCSSEFTVSQGGYQTPEG